MEETEGEEECVVELEGETDEEPVEERDAEAEGESVSVA